MNFEYVVTIDNEVRRYPAWDFEYALADFLGRGFGKATGKIEKVKIDFNKDIDLGGDSDGS